MNIKKKVAIIVIVCVVLLVGAFIIDRIVGKNYFSEIEYDAIIEKIENDESFVLLISQTTCGHCKSYKPKLEAVANEYKLSVYYIDVDLLSEDEYNELNSHLSFSSAGTPLTLFLKNGEETTVATRIKGDASKEKIERKLKSNDFID